MGLIDVVCNPYDGFVAWTNANQGLSAWVQATFTIAGLGLAFHLGGKEHSHQIAIQKESKRERLSQQLALIKSAETSVKYAVVLINKRAEGTKLDAAYMDECADLIGQLEVINRRIGDLGLGDMNAQQVLFYTKLEYKLNLVIKYLDDVINHSHLPSESLIQLYESRVLHVKEIHEITKALMYGISESTKALR